MMTDTKPAGDTNLYAAPLADTRNVTYGPSTEFYVVSSTKFFLLFFLTAGIYQIYWFYRHWKCFKLYRNLDLWPVPRTIFSIFFTHSLADEIDGRLRKVAPTFRWSPRLIATSFVLTTIVSSIVSRMAWRGIGYPAIDMLNLALVLPLALLGHAMQRAANAACDDPTGASNARLTWANWLWMVFGCLLWLLALAGLFLPPEDLD